MIAPLRFRFDLGGGQVVEGVVRGAGDMVHHADRMRQQCRRARNGRRLGVYEPTPGCVAVYPEYTAASDGPVTIVPAASFIGEVSS